MKVDAKAAFGLLVIVTPNFNLAATVGFLDPFRASNYLDGSILFRWDLASAAGGDIIASNGISVRTRALREVRNQPQDMVIVSSSWAPETYNGAPLHSALLRWARAGVTLGAIDTGAFILAEAGLLKGKRATTHYEHINSLRESTSTPRQARICSSMTAIASPVAVAPPRRILPSMSYEACTGIRSPMPRHAISSIRPCAPKEHRRTRVPWSRWAVQAPSVLKQAIKLMEDNLEDAFTISQICPAHSTIAATARSAVCAVREEESRALLPRHPSRSGAQPCHANRYAVVGDCGRFRLLQPSAFRPGLPGTLWSCAQDR